MYLLDGSSDDEYGPVAKAIRDDEVDIFAVGVGRARKNELVEITGDEVIYEFWPKNDQNFSNEFGKRELSTTSASSTKSF